MTPVEKLVAEIMSGVPTPGVPQDWAVFVLQHGGHGWDAVRPHRFRTYEGIYRFAYCSQCGALHDIETESVYKLPVFTGKMAAAFEWMNSD